MVPLRNPVSMNTQKFASGIHKRRTHQPDLFRSCKRLTLIAMYSQPSAAIKNASTKGKRSRLSMPMSNATGNQHHDTQYILRLILPSNENKRQKFMSVGETGSSP